MVSKTSDTLSATEARTMTDTNAAKNAAKAEVEQYNYISKEIRKAAEKGECSIHILHEIHSNNRRAYSELGYIVKDNGYISW